MQGCSFGWLEIELLLLVFMEIELVLLLSVIEPLTLPLVLLLLELLFWLTDTKDSERGTLGAV
jgi:hypothetical protein